MTLSTFTAGQVLTATALNNVHKQCVITCTAGTRPSSPPEGMAIYETDTDKFLVYTSATTGWVPPWNQPWGIVTASSGGTSGYGYVKLTSSAQSGIGSSLTDVTNATATFTAVANRLYEVRAFAPLTASGATTAQVALLVDGTQLATSLLSVTTAGAYGERMAVVEYVTTLSAGSHTVKLQASCAAGTLTVSHATATPTVLSVKDVGPVGAPA